MSNKMLFLGVVLIMIFAVLGLVAVSNASAQTTAPFTAWITSSQYHYCGGFAYHGNLWVKDLQTGTEYYSKTGSNCQATVWVTIGHYYQWGTWIDGDPAQYQCVGTCMGTNAYMSEYGIYYAVRWDCLYSGGYCPNR